MKIVSLFAWLISHQPTVLFSQSKPATSNQPAVLFSQNKPATAISHQPNEQAVYLKHFMPILGTAWFMSISSKRDCQSTWPAGILPKVPPNGTMTRKVEALVPCTCQIGL
jgi:hypothetical protein